jgi:hypothetical protein
MLPFSKLRKSVSVPAKSKEYRLTPLKPKKPDSAQHHNDTKNLCRWNSPGEYGRITTEKLDDQTRNTIGGDIRQKYRSLECNPSSDPPHN